MHRRLRVIGAGAAAPMPATVPKEGAFPSRQKTALEGKKRPGVAHLPCNWARNSATGPRNSRIGCPDCKILCAQTHGHAAPFTCFVPTGSARKNKLGSSWVAFGPGVGIMGSRGSTET